MAKTTQFGGYDRHLSTIFPDYHSHSHPMEAINALFIDDFPIETMSLPHFCHVITIY